MRHHVISYSDFCVTEGITRVPYETRAGWNRQIQYKNLILGKNTTIEKILKFIYKGGDSGRSWKEIHRFIVEKIKGLKQNISINRSESNRGYYSTFFTNFLPYFSSKTDDRKWIISDPVLLAYFSGDKKSINDLISKKVATVVDNNLKDSTHDLLTLIRLAKHPNISDETLLKLAISSEEKVRRTAIKNPQFKNLPQVKLAKKLGVTLEDLYDTGVI